MMPPEAEAYPQTRSCTPSTSKSAEASDSGVAEADCKAEVRRSGPEYRAGSGRPSWKLTQGLPRPWARTGAGLRGELVEATSPDSRRTVKETTATRMMRNG